MTRAHAVERIQKAGGTYAREPGPSTAILVAGEASGHLTSSGAISRNMELFRGLKNQGVPIQLIEESEFLKLLGGEDESEDFSRLYTAEQVSRIVEAPLPGGAGVDSQGPAPADPSCQPPGVVRLQGHPDCPQPEPAHRFRRSRLPDIQEPVTDRALAPGWGADHRPAGGLRPGPSCPPAGWELGRADRAAIDGVP